MEASSVLFRRYSKESLVIIEEQFEDGIPYDDNIGEDYVVDLVLKPDDEEFIHFGHASWLLVYSSIEMICSKICNFITVSMNSERGKKKTYQIVCRRSYSELREAVTDLGTELLGFSSLSVEEAVERIKCANQRHNVVDEGEVVALKVIPL